MALADSITRGAKSGHPQSLILHGPAGVGKTTLASKLVSPIFLPVEGGSEWIDVPKLPRPETAKDLLKIIDAFLAEKLYEEFKTFVVDSIDWVEAAIKQMLADVNFDMSWGKGAEEIDKHIRKFLRTLDKLVKNQMWVVLTSHSGKYKINTPEGMSYDKIELDLTKHARKTVAEWADNIFYMEPQTRVIGADDDGKGVGKQTGRRIVHTVGTATYEAKNRMPGIPEEFDASNAQVVRKFMFGEEE